MLNIYMTRHGETEWNILKKMQGRLNSPLTEKGKFQARKLSERLNEIHITTIYASSSERALLTAEIIRGDRSIEIVPCDELREIDLGLWEGMGFAEVEKKYPEMSGCFWNEPHNYKPIDGIGETFSDVLARVLAFMNDVAKNHDNESILIVTHAVVLKVVLAYFEGKPINALLDGTLLPPACLNLVRFDGTNFSVIFQGDTSHFG